MTNPETLAAFLAPDASLEGARAELPLTLPNEAMAGPRAADLALLLGLIAAFWGIGALIRRGGATNFRPFVFAAGLTGALLLFGTNTDFYEVAGIDVTAETLTVTRHVGSDTTIVLNEINSIEIKSGSLYPMFSDDRSLVITTTSGNTVAIPRFIPRVEEAVRELAARLPALSNRLDQDHP